MQRTKINTEVDARQKAIDWQHWACDRSLSYLELADWRAYFLGLARRFNLIREFKENGII
jgi:hypothetical protein